MTEQIAEKINCYIVELKQGYSKPVPQERHTLASLKPGEALVFPICPGRHYTHKNRNGETQFVCAFQQKMRKWAYSIRDHEDFTFFVQSFHDGDKLVVYRPK